MKTVPRPGGGGKGKSRERRYHCHVPETFDPAAATDPKWAAYAEWLVGAIVIRRFIERTEPETFVPLDSRYIRKHIPDRVRRPMLDDLIDKGVVECDEVYYFGTYCPPGCRGKCFCYRIGPAHRGAKVRGRPATHPELLRKMKAAHAEFNAEVTGPTHDALRRWHDRVELTPDAPFGEHPLLDVMIDGERRFSVCEQGRVHTNIANLPSQYRRFVRLAGRELVSVDIATSQPLILALLLNGCNAVDQTEIHAMRQYMLGGQGGQGGPFLFPYPPPPSARAFLKDCLSGCVYDLLAEISGYTRDETKPKFLAVIFGKPDDMDTKVGRAMKALYPDVFTSVVEANVQLGHSGLPRAMQKLESAVMIDRVAGRLVRENPPMPLLTVHDSILTPPEHVDRVEGVIAEEWQAAFGVVPRMKRSDFTAPQEPRSARSRAKPKPSPVGGDGHPLPTRDAKSPPP